MRQLEPVTSMAGGPGIKCCAEPGCPRFAPRFSALIWVSKLFKAPKKLICRDQFVQSFRRTDHWHLVISPPVEQPTCFLFSYSAPLLKEKRNIVPPTLVANRYNPIPQHRPRTRSAFTADDHPINISQVDLAQVLEQRFD